MILTKYFLQFFQKSQSSGVLLLFCVFISLFIANSPASQGFQTLLNENLGPYSVSMWINDGLMAVFFLLVGLEIKREVVEGELSSVKRASLPIFAAIGGMLIPALIYIGFNHGTEYANGWGIPMATDIAFSLAIVSMLGKKVPSAVKIFLAALAIVDDLGAILVIAIFYTDTVHWYYLIMSAVSILILILLNFFKVKNIILYLIPGVFLWYFVHHSGIHATIAGVVLAFCIPTNVSTTEISPLEKLEGFLHTPVSFIIMPIFALANTNITFQLGMVEDLFSSFGYGIILGLSVGKVVGVLLFSFLAVKFKISDLPDRSSWLHISGAGFLAGIGFTMSVFISILSFKHDVHLQNEAKFAILIASILSGFFGYFLLKISKPKEPQLKHI